MRTGELLPDLIADSARASADAVALRFGGVALSYAELDKQVSAFAQALTAAGVRKHERVAIYLDQRIETVVASFGAARAGAIFVPVNPLLRPRQVAYILGNCTASVLITANARHDALRIESVLPDSLRTIVLIDEPAQQASDARIFTWRALLQRGGIDALPPVIDFDPVAILYTSGSTGQPKGVVLSHRNMVAGARSVSAYFKLAPPDRLLCALPLSFDAGFSQLTTSFAAGACAVLANHLLPADIPKLVRDHAITGLCAVPPLWRKLAAAHWPDDSSLRFIANTGGAMDRRLLTDLRARFPNADVYLMYGFTEAFRSTYLDPAQIDKRPESIGKAIPNAEVLVLRDDGSACAPGVVGELVQRGALVARGYWADAEATAKTFRRLPSAVSGVRVDEIAAWSGDLVRADGEGYLYFIARRDEMIKTSGYRISPDEIEAILNETGLVQECCVIGVPHEELGQAIVAIVAAPGGRTLDIAQLNAECQRQLPAYMVPKLFVQRETLQRNSNGKIDRAHYHAELRGAFDHAPVQ